MTERLESYVNTGGYSLSNNPGWGGGGMSRGRNHNPEYKARCKKIADEIIRLAKLQEEKNNQ